MKNFIVLLVLIVAIILPGSVRSGELKASEESTSAKTQGPLRVHPENPRYFTDGSGRAVLLVGSHTWANMIDMGPDDPPAPFDYEAYLDWMESFGHNFFRLWTWELTKWDTGKNGAAHLKEKPHFVTPHAWLRTGPGPALDGKPKFDLDQFNPAYFERLRSRVAAAGRRGIYASVMLFEGWGMQFAPGAWEAHPFHEQNNINGINGDTDGDGTGLEIHRLGQPRITALQEKYVRKVIETVNDLDNVLYEISNENHPPSTEWQYHMIRFVQSTQQALPKQHPVGMTFQYKGGSNGDLFKSPAVWISPNSEGGYRTEPPPADGKKVIVSDTDHFWGIGGNPGWVWKSFLRGYNLLFMDPYDGVVLANRFDPEWDPIRRALGHALTYSQRMNLAAMKPSVDLSSTKYCLAEPGREYLIFFPEGGTATVDLEAASGNLKAEWFDPEEGKVVSSGKTSGGGVREFTPPFNGSAVLYIHKADSQ